MLLPLFFFFLKKKIIFNSRGEKGGFLRLSMVGIIPKAANQAKNVTLKGTLFHQILFQEKGVHHGGQGL